MIEKKLFAGRGQPDVNQENLPVRLLMSDKEHRQWGGGVLKRTQKITDRPVFVTSDITEGPWGLTICVGTEKLTQLLERKIPITSTRRGIAWIEDGDVVRPVRWVPSIDYGKNNLFAGQSWKQDLELLLTFPTPPCPFHLAYNVIESKEDSQQAVDYLRTLPFTAYDCETAGLMFSETFEISMLCASAPTGDGYVTYAWNRTALESDALDPLKQWLEDPSAKKVGHNIKFDMLAPKTAWGVQVRGVISDTRLKRKLIHADAIASLEVCSELVGMGGYKQEFGEALVAAKKYLRRAKDQEKKGQLSLMGDFEPNVIRWAKQRLDLKADVFAYSLVPPEILEVYCARDALATALLERRLNTELDQGTAHIWNSVLSKASAALERVESWGVLTDLEAMKNFEATVLEQREEVAKELASYGLDSPTSPAKVADFLFNDLGLTPLKKSDKTGNPSTDAATLEALKGDHEAVPKLLEFKRLQKLGDAYGQKMAMHIRDDGRIHPELKPDGTRTGRLSCRNPGLHQIPRAQSKEGKMIKDCFIAAPGCTLVQLDYSQLELRVAAMLSEDKVMIDMFKSGKDFHSQTAALVAPVMWGVSTEEVSEKLSMDEDSPEYKSVKPYRTAAKVFNFGLLYGMTVNGLAARLQCEPEEAGRLKKVILGEWKSLAKWIDEQIKYAESYGLTHTWWNGEEARKREIWKIANGTKLDRLKGRNAAINTPVQGTASDYCLASICKIVDWIDRDSIDAKLVLSVHDSIILEAATPIYEDVAKTAQGIMQGWESKGVPLKVDCEVGVRWGSLHKLDI